MYSVGVGVCEWVCVGVYFCELGVVFPPHIHIHKYTYTHIHTHTHTDRQKQTHTHTHTPLSQEVVGWITGDR